MIKPRNTSTELQVLIQQAQFLHQNGQLLLAAEHYTKLLNRFPKNPQLLTGLGTLALQLGNHQQAEILLGKALKILPNQEQALYHRGLALALLNRLEEAITCYSRTIKLNPTQAELYNLRGSAWQELKQFEKALADYEKAITLKPDFAVVYNERGNVLQGLKRFAEAIASFDQALALKADYAEAYFNRGNTQKELSKLDDALASYTNAITIKADFVEAYNNQGLTAYSLGQFAQALLSFDQAITLKPNFAEAYHNRGLALDRLKRHTQALESFEQAIHLKPDYAEAYLHHGESLLQLDRRIEALNSYEQAIILNPDYTEAYGMHGLILNELGQYKAAITSYDKALALNADYPYLHGQYLYTKMQICDWQDIEKTVAEITAKIAQGAPASTAFTFMLICGNLVLQRRAIETVAANKYPAAPNASKIVKYPQHDKIRVAYFSMDFRNHAVAYLTAELFEKHDRARFEITAFSFGPDVKDEMRIRLEAGFDRFIDVRDQSDQEVAQLARTLEIDIAVDLAGYTGDCRPGIFALRAAPLQLSYIGFLGTMCADYMDYLLADPVLIPVTARSHYVENIIYLPSYQVNDSKRRIPDTLFTREQLGLPASGFVFCCFNNNFKITETTFSGWMRILDRVAGSVLFLYAENETAKQNLQKAAEARGVSADRLIFGKTLAYVEYLARFRAADLFLDTLPYNAGTTASDALWAGVPVLTCIGEAFASRIAASLLTAIGLPELITSTQAEYEALAIELASHPEKLAALKAKLAQNRQTTLLFDSQRFADHLEAAYTEIYQRYQADLPAADIQIPAISSSR